MSDELDLPPLDGGTPAPSPDGVLGDLDLQRLTQVEVELTVEVGRTRMTLGEALALGPGSVVTIDRLADQPVDLLVNSRRIARGEVVVVDEQFGLRITEVVGAATAHTNGQVVAAPSNGQVVAAPGGDAGPATDAPAVPAEPAPFEQHAA